MASPTHPAPPHLPSDLGTVNTTQSNGSCTINTCSLSNAIITYQPNIGGNAFFLSLFGVLFLVHLYYGVRHKTWSFMAAMVIGLILEGVGYIGRLQLHGDPFFFNYFLVYLICLTIGPAFFTAAIYITFRRVVYSCSEELSWIRPRTISIIFMTCDFICLVLQAVGGAITSTSNDASKAAVATRQTGVNVMIAGLAFQVVSLFLFISYAATYMWRWHAESKLEYRHRMKSEPTILTWKALVLGLSIASVTIFVRCVFRVAELRQGFSSTLANNEVAFMILEGTMISIACLALTFGHPALCLDIPWKLPKQVPPNGTDTDLETMGSLK